MTTQSPYPKRADLAALSDGDEITIIPADVHTAAKRGFVRTTAQAFAASIPTAGVSAASLISLVQDPDPVVLICTGVAAILSPLLAGVASYLSIIGAGIPDAYRDEIITDPTGPLTAGDDE